MNTSDIDCESILSKLILLTEQYKRLNELLENKQNMLKQRANELQMRRIKHKYQMQKMWLWLSRIDDDDDDNNRTMLLSSMLIEDATSFKTNTN